MIDRKYYEFIPVEGVCRTITLDLNHDGTVDVQEIDLGYQGDSCVTTLNVNASKLLWNTRVDEYTMFLIVKGIGAFIMDEGYLELPKQITNVAGTHEMVVTIQLTKTNGDVFDRVFTSNTIKGHVAESSYELFKDIEGNGTEMPTYPNTIDNIQSYLMKNPKVVEWNRPGEIKVIGGRKETEEDKMRLGYYGDEEVSFIKLTNLIADDGMFGIARWDKVIAAFGKDEQVYYLDSDDTLAVKREFEIPLEVLRTPGLWKFGLLLKRNQPIDDSIAVNEFDNPLYNYHAYSNVLEFNVTENILVDMEEEDWRNPSSYINVYDRNNVLLHALAEDDTNE